MLLVEAMSPTFVVLALFAAPNNSPRKWHSGYPSAKKVPWVFGFYWNCYCFDIRKPQSAIPVSKRNFYYGTVDLGSDPDMLNKEFTQPAGRHRSFMHKHNLYVGFINGSRRSLRLSPGYDSGSSGSAKNPIAFVYEVKKTSAARSCEARLNPCTVKYPRPELPDLILLPRLKPQ